MLIFERLLRSILINFQICFLLAHLFPVERSNRDLVVVLDKFWLWPVNGLLDASDLRGLRLDWLIDEAGVLPVWRGCDGRLGNDRTMIGRLGFLRCIIYCFWILNAQRKHLPMLRVPGERGPRHSRLWHSTVAEDFLKTSSRRIVPGLWRANSCMILHLHSEVVFTSDFHCFESFVIYDEFAHFDTIK